jgi:ADP-ribosylglycohydrolase
MLGLALGDACGAPVEFATRSEIIKAFGPDGVRGLEPWDGRPRGAFTDDTQMMLATARGLLDATQAWRTGGVDDVSSAIHARYLEWYGTQADPVMARRPGNTCLTALASGVPGGTFEPINDSKGSGGIMRVAPVGLAYAPERAFEVGMETAALTHGHPTGYLAAGFFADVVARVARGTGLAGAVAETREIAAGYDDVDETLDAADRAVELYISDVHPTEGVPLIGQGWIAEEALGIALFCALSYPQAWEEGVLAAVNITGDSDTTGCLVGALLGAALGYGALPPAWLEDLEDREIIEQLAEELRRTYPPESGAEDD